MPSRSQIAILAEDRSDTETLAVFVRRILGDDRLSVVTQSFGGCGGLKTKCGRVVVNMMGRGIDRFVVCVDADRRPPNEVREEIRIALSQRVKSLESVCITVPVQEIEAWLLADEVAINKRIPSFRFAGHDNPERIEDPKEWLRSQSRALNSKPKYVPAVHNPRVAPDVRLDVVARKCQSFRSFRERLMALGG